MEWERDVRRESDIHEESLPVPDQENGNRPISLMPVPLASLDLSVPEVKDTLYPQVIREEQLIWYEEQKINKKQRYASYLSLNKNLNTLGTAYRKATMRADPNNPGTAPPLPTCWLFFL